jgi:hypothetical protein
MQRYALSFVVRLGSEHEVARILSSYGRPDTNVNPQTRLLRTSVFMHGNRVVHSMDIEGDMPTALRHLAIQPEVRAVENALNPHLVEQRDLDDPASAGAFFARSALPKVGNAEPVPDGVERHAVLVPVAVGRGTAVANALAGLGGNAPGVAGGTVFCRDDVVVWLLEGDPVDDSLAVLARGATTDPAVAALTGTLALDADLRTEQGWQRLFTAGAMRMLTDRRAEAQPQPEASNAA